VITSYFPLTAPLVLVLRNGARRALALEIALSITAMLAYIVIAFAIAVKLFRLGRSSTASGCR
jgi:ABC-type Na+ efflux pump permease subunit